MQALPPWVRIVRVVVPEVPHHVVANWGQIFTFDSRSLRVLGRRGWRRDARSGEARTRQEERRAMVDDDPQTRQYLLARFWEAALGFWRKGGGRTAWLLTFTVITIALLNLGLQYRLNVWHRAMFDALDKRDGSGVLCQSMIFFPLILATVSVAAAATYSKLTLQPSWRRAR